MKHECPMILQELREKVSTVEEKAKEINGTVRHLDETGTKAVRTFFGLTENKFVAAVLAACVIGAGAWIINGINNRPDADAFNEVKTRQTAVLERLAEIQTFRALTESRLAAIERQTSINGQSIEINTRLLERIAAKLQVSAQH
jgi:hypothetical protein